MRQVLAVRIARLAEGTSLSRGGVSSLLQLKGSLCSLLFLMKVDRCECVCECESECDGEQEWRQGVDKRGRADERTGIWVLGEEMGEESEEGVGKKKKENRSEHKKKKGKRFLKRKKAEKDTRQERSERGTSPAERQKFALQVA